MYYTYIIRCEDETLYTGITTDISRRMEEHKSGGNNSAKYTRTHGFKAVEAVWESADRSTASKLEYRIKQLSRSQKLSLAEGIETLESLFDRTFSENYTKHSG